MSELERNLEKEVADGTRARTVLDSEAFKQAVDRVQNAIIDEFASIPPTEVQKLQVARIKLSALADIVRDLQAVMTTGELASKEVAEKDVLREQRKAIELNDKVRIRAMRGMF